MRGRILELYEMYKDFFTLPIENHERYLSEVINCDPIMKGLAIDFENLILQSVSEPIRTRDMHEQSEASNRNKPHHLVYRSVSYANSYANFMTKRHLAEALFTKVNQEYKDAIVELKQGNLRPFQTFLNKYPEISDFLDRKIIQLKEAAERWYGMYHEQINHESNQEQSNQAQLDRLIGNVANDETIEPYIRNFMMSSLTNLDMNTHVSNEFFQKQFKSVHENLSYLSTIVTSINQIIARESKNKNFLTADFFDADELLDQLFKEQKSLRLDNENYKHNLNSSIYGLVMNKIRDLSTSYEKMEPKPQVKKKFSFFTKPDYADILKEIIPDKDSRKKIRKILGEKGNATLLAIVRFVVAQYRTNNNIADLMQNVFLTCLENDKVSALKAAISKFGNGKSEEEKLKKIFLENKIAQLESEILNKKRSKPDKKIF